MNIPSTYNLKPAFQRLLMPAMQALRRWGISPNALTWMAIAWSGALGWMFVQGFDDPRWYFAIAAGLLLRMVLNALDGMMARHFEMTSTAGAFLNELGDVVSDALVMWPLALLPGVHPGWVGGLLWLSALNEMTGVLGGWLKGERRYEGPMGKSDRTLVWGLFCLLLGAGVAVIQWVEQGIAVVMVCLVLSTFIRIRKALKP
jgi:CDP-diacylglycerol--glycerol-3-phosphate 3-phosphatidyltransferase